MVLIFSINGDNATCQVIKWLLYYKIPFIRVNSNEKLEVEEISIGGSSNSKCVLKNYMTKEIIDLDKIKVVWYRKGLISIRSYDLGSIKNLEIIESIKEYIIEEKRVLLDYILFIFSKKNIINQYWFKEVNKLEVLYRANILGLNIPYTRVIKEKSKIQSISQITKSLSDPFRVEINSTTYASYTEELDLRYVPKFFFSSLIQTKIEKEADIRVFYFFGSFYSMAIMSQETDQTKTDFRKYCQITPNRRIPFSIPRKIEKMLDLLLKELKLETGSIDLILTKTGQFVFLEVNPVGQFEMNGESINNYLFKLFADKLKSFYL